MEESDALARLRDGDIAGLETLVALYQSQALDVAYIISHDRPLAEDVVQTAFIRAYERIAQLRPGSAFGPWFLRSVINDTLKAVTRSHNVTLDTEALEQAGYLASPEENNYGKRSDKGGSENVRNARAIAQAGLMACHLPETTGQSQCGE
jgi:RNA polymerase sigma factor (sigma-70 family)